MRHRKISNFFFKPSDKPHPNPGILANNRQLYIPGHLQKTWGWHGKRDFGSLRTKKKVTLAGISTYSGKQANT